MENQETNKELELLEVAMSAVKFLGLEEGYKEPFIRRLDWAHLVQVNLATQHCSELNYPSYDYDLSVHLFLNPEGKIDSICVNEFQASYDDYVNDLFEWHFDEVSKNTYFKKIGAGQLEVTSNIRERCVHTYQGVDKRTESTTTEVYEFDGDWKNLSSDMKKVGQVSKKIKK